MTARLAVALLFVLSCAHPHAVARDHIKFSHGAHLVAGLSCTTCHAVVPNATASHDVALPTETQCRNCHTRPEQQQCDYCHTTPLAPQRFERVDRELHFSHARHASRVHGNCEACHGMGADTRSAAAFEPRVPNMEGCTQRCHATELRALACTRCHDSLRRFAIDEISVARHGAGWLERHGTAARAMSGTCSQCHEPSFCSRCHSAAPGLPVADLDPMDVTNDFVHRGDWFARHPEEARFQTVSCLRCHGVEYCDGCHRTSGVGGGVGPASIHPPGWLNPASPNSHAREARRNLTTCAGCHESDATQICTPCHRVGGVAGNPHPPGFRAGIDPNQHAVCLVCHRGGP